MKSNAMNPILVCSMKPSSVGSVMIRIMSPLESPIVDSAFLTEESGMSTINKVAPKARELIKASQLCKIVGKVLTPSVDDREKNIQKFSGSYPNSTGTRVRYRTPQSS